MKPTLIVLGILALVYPGFSYTTQDEKHADIGPIHLQANVPEHHYVQVPQVLGILALVGGIAVVIVSAKKS